MKFRKNLEPWREFKFGVLWLTGAVIFAAIGRPNFGAIYFIMFLFSGYRVYVSSLGVENA